jgi:hypothetical protein
MTGGIVEIPAAVNQIADIAALQGYKVVVEYAAGRKPGSASAWIRIAWVPAERWLSVPLHMRPRMGHPYPETLQDVIRLSHWLAMFGVEF